MAINTNSTKDFTAPVVPAQATSVETTHMVFNFTEGAGYIRQVHKDSNGNTLSRRFIRVTGASYAAIEAAIESKVQLVADKIEDGRIVLEDGTSFEEVGRDEAFGQVKQ